MASRWPTVVTQGVKQALKRPTSGERTSFGVTRHNHSNSSCIVTSGQLQRVTSGVNHTFTRTPYQVETQVTQIQVKVWSTVLHITQTRLTVLHTTLSCLTVLHTTLPCLSVLHTTLPWLTVLHATKSSKRNQSQYKQRIPIYRYIQKWHIIEYYYLHLTYLHILQLLWDVFRKTKAQLLTKLQVYLSSPLLCYTVPNVLLHIYIRRH